MSASLANRKYVPYSSVVTTGDEDEKKYIEGMRGYFGFVQQSDNKDHGHAYPTTHAKTLGMVKGKVIVSNDLPAHLKQGPFAEAGEYGVLLRYSVGSHNVKVDTNQSVGRAVSFKIFSFPGDRFPEGEGNMTQDFAMNSQLMVSELADAKTAYEMIGNHLKGASDPAELKRIILARPDAALQTAPALQPRRLLQAMEYYSQHAHRFGDYVCKHGLIPATDVQQKARETILGPGEASVEKLQTSLKQFHSENEAVYDWKFQLCENLEDQPTEYAGKLWDPERYPYQTVAKLVFPKQDPLNEELIAFWHDHLRLNQWRGTKALEPLGGSNRVRRQMYPWSQGNRSEFNKSKFIDVQRIEDLPGPLPPGAIPDKSQSKPQPIEGGIASNTIFSKLLEAIWSMLPTSIKNFLGKR